MDNPNCIFCKIISKEIPCNTIHEDNNFLAFLDIHPHAKGHSVVIPKKHADDIFDLSDVLQSKLIRFVTQTMGKINTALHPNGFNVGWNQNEVAGQVVPHLHLHIIPRYKGDGGGSMHSIIKNPGEKTVEEVSKLF